jgi:citrate lyase beta subunit
VTEFAAPRSLLFVPGTRPERFAKALDTGADLVCIDLEDAVPPEQKAAARSTALDFLAAAAPTVPVGVRINALTTADGIADMHALLERGLAPRFVMLPKTEAAAQARQLQQLLPAQTQVVPIIESAAALALADDIFALPGIETAVFGAVDFVADVGCELAWEPLLAARGQLVLAGTRHDVTVLDVPYTDVKNLEGLKAETLRAKALGFRARSAIHPAQIPVIHEALMPTAEELAQAQRVVDAFDSAAGGAALLDGKLIELPIIKAARRMLAQAAR